MNRTEWDRAAGKLVAIYNRPMPEATRAAWYAELERLPGAHVQDAVDRLCRESERHPSLTQLISAAHSAGRRRGAPATSIDPPDTLPKGIVAIIRSSNYQDIAVEGTAPWAIGRLRIPADITVTEILGAPPSDLYVEAPHHWAEPPDPPEVQAGIAALADQFDGRTNP